MILLDSSSEEAREELGLRSHGIDGIMMITATMITTSWVGDEEGGRGEAIIRSRCLGSSDREGGNATF